MRTTTLSTIKSLGSKAIPDNAPIYLIVNSQVKSVLVPPKEYDALIRMQEELEDIYAIEQRRGEPTIGWEEMFPKKKRSNKRSQP